MTSSSSSTDEILLVQASGQETTAHLLAVNHYGSPTTTRLSIVSRREILHRRRRLKRRRRREQSISCTSCSAPCCYYSSCCGLVNNNSTRIMVPPQQYYARRRPILLVLLSLLQVVVKTTACFVYHPETTTSSYHQTSCSTSSFYYAADSILQQQTSFGSYYSRWVISEEHYAKLGNSNMKLRRNHRRSDGGIRRTMMLNAAAKDESSILDDDADDESQENDNDDDDEPAAALDQGGSASVPSSSPTELQLLQRVTQLEQLVASQQVQIRRLLQETKRLTESVAAFSQLIDILREAGLIKTKSDPSASGNNKNDDDDDIAVGPPPATRTVRETFDDAGIFGTAPATVMDAADSAGASILAGLLGGKKRMLVDVRDAELSFDPVHVETLVQFIELAILPVAAGLEGLQSQRNRLKIVFPTVSQLLSYRKAMALAAPEVVALSTLGFDPVEQKDNLVVLVAPAPDDEEGLTAMNELLESTSITQPLVVLNHHMVPVSGPAADFDVAYHLRLLSVQYMSGDHPEQYFQQTGAESIRDVQHNSSTPSMRDKTAAQLSKETTVNATATAASFDDENVTAKLTDKSTTTEDIETTKEEDAALEAAMKRAQELGVNHGITRAMVIRAYPRPWHVFVDTSPDTDADFEVAATFDKEPTSEQINHAIIECLEGSEHEDELVAQEMQRALELGQLDRVTEMLTEMGLKDFDDEDDDDEEDDDGNFYRNMFGEDSV